MCGILGSIGSRPPQPKWERACRIQRSRGPDASGEWHGRVGRLDVSVAHQRLSIIDLSDAGAQPMVHPESGSVLTFNGEIYNYIELRARLEADGERFRGQSDTEVLLRALDRWGIEKTLPLLNGMWAFAWVDLRECRVVLSRDRFGEKPLHIAAHHGQMMFASDIRAILALAAHRWPLDYRSVTDFLTLGLVDTGVRTMFSGITQIPAATWLEIRESNFGRLPEPRQFWSCPVEAAPCPMAELVEQTGVLLRDSVRIRLRSDVPVGLLLSGGLDSSAIAAAVHTLGHENVTMFSLANNDPSVDESPFVDIVASHFSRQVRQIRLPTDPNSLLGHFERVVRCMGTPISSLSNIAHWLIMREANDQGITVLLSGQGGDELLCGYRKYLGFHLQDLLRRKHFYSALRTIAEFARQGTVLRQFDWTHAARYLPRWWPQKRSAIPLGPLTRPLRATSGALLSGESVQQRQRRDLAELSVPALTHNEDRTSMDWSREIRLPFLDHRLAELLVPAPAEQKLHRGWTKFPLRAAIAPMVPAAIAWRRDKQGFASPEAVWLRSSLRQHFEARMLFREARAFTSGLLDFNAFSQRWELFQSDNSREGWSRFFVCALALEVWIEQFEQDFAT